MGLPGLTVNGDLATNWRGILEENGLNVFPDDATGGPSEKAGAQKRLSEFLWRVGNGSHDLQILEVKYHARHDGDVDLIFMPSKTRDSRQLFEFVHGLLVASGATFGERKKPAID